MKTSYKILLSVVAGAFLFFYLSIANNLLHFSYLLVEASLLIVVIYGTIGLCLNRDFRNHYGRKVLFGQVVLMLATHILRVVWLLYRDNVIFQVSYFLKGYLFKHTLILAGSSFLIASIVSLFILILRLPRRKMLRVAVILLVFFIGISLSFYLYMNRDLAHKGIHVDYSIDSIEEIRRAAIDQQKAVYVDFWHSGCGPCLKEFSQHENFSKLVDGQRVHFLFIGVDRSVPGEKQKQRIIIEKYNLKGTHTFISKEEFSEILDNAGYKIQIHGVKAFPHHMIISSEGEILEIKAQGPSPEMAFRLNSSN